MHPLLFEIGPFKLHTYGALMGLGFLVAMHLLNRGGKRLGVAEEHVQHLVMIAFLGGILGARLLFVLIDSPMSYFREPLEVFKIWNGGLVFFGGFLTATAGMAWYAHRHKIAIWKVFDLCTAPLVLAHALGRLGCFMAGCCYGKICHLPWAVTFTDPRGVGLKNVPLHPTQIYESLFLVALYFFLLTLRPLQRFHGMVFLIYLAIYAVGRSIIELFRNDMRGQLFGLSTAQLLSIVIFTVAVVCFSRKFQPYVRHS